MKTMDLFNKRWSPRAFANKLIEPEKIDALFEAARWAPSSMNEQPWRYYYAVKSDAQAFNKFADCLVPGNQVWARNAALLILSVAKKQFSYKNRNNAYALHDTGAANAYLALQAAHLGLQAHQMGGFNKSQALKQFHLDPEQYEPATVIAVGYEGNASQLSAELKKQELAPRSRHAVDRIVFQIKN